MKYTKLRNLATSSVTQIYCNTAMVNGMQLSVDFFTVIVPSNQVMDQA